MKKLDKNEKLSSGKSKGSSTEPKTKGGSNRTAAKGPAAAETKSGKREAAAKPAPTGTKAKSDSSRRTISAKAGRTTEASKASASIRGRAKSESGHSTTAEPNLEEFSISLIKPGEKTERLWRTKSFHQMPTQREFGFPDVAPELPGGYGQDKLVLMPKDPEYMFCYWELTPSLIEHKSLEKASDGNYRETLKINWESRSLFEPNFTFIPVFFWARKWYFGVPQVGQRYQVELGWLGDNGHFISIISSNLSELPESWAATQKRLTDQGEVLAYTSRNTKVLGASENLVVEDTRAFAPEWNLSSESFSSSSWSRGPSAGGAEGDNPAAAVAAAPAREGSKSGAKGRKPAKPATPRARLEISGKVLPGTKVHVAGNIVATDKQGNFKIDFPYDRDVLNLELTSRSGASRTFTYDLKELVLT